MIQGFTYDTLRQSISSYLRIRGDEFDKFIRGRVNAIILNFCRIRDWQKLITSVAFDLDGSEEYNLNDVLVDEHPFLSCVQVSVAGERKYLKDLAEYLDLDDNGDYFSIAADVLRVAGDGSELVLTYKTPGRPFPFTEANKTETPLVVGYYADIIECMVVSEYLKSQRDQSWVDEQNRANFLVQSAIADENRERNQGMEKIISRA